MTRHKQRDITFKLPRSMHEEHSKGHTPRHGVLTADNSNGHLPDRDTSLRSCFVGTKKSIWCWWSLLMHTVLMCTCCYSQEKPPVFQQHLLITSGRGGVCLWRGGGYIVARSGYRAIVFASKRVYFFNGQRQTCCIAYIVLATIAVSE